MLFKCPEGFLCGSAGKESACSVGDLGSTPGLGRSHGRGHGNPLHCSCLENPYGQRSLAGCSPWGRTESDTTERLNTAQSPVRWEGALTLLQWSWAFRGLAAGRHHPTFTLGYKDAFYLLWGNWGIEAKYHIQVHLLVTWTRVNWVGSLPLISSSMRRQKPASSWEIIFNATFLKNQNERSKSTMNKI